MHIIHEVEEDLKQCYANPYMRITYNKYKLSQQSAVNIQKVSLNNFI